MSRARDSLQGEAPISSGLMWPPGDDLYDEHRRIKRKPLSIAEDPDAL